MREIAWKFIRSLQSRIDAAIIAKDTSERYSLGSDLRVDLYRLQFNCADGA